MNLESFQTPAPRVYRTKQNADPTGQTYDALNRAYALFNVALFDNQLPACLITMQRVSKAYGYFAGDRFGSRAGDSVADEIALNPSYFRDRTTEQSLSTLAHEMAHLWQHHFGKPSRSGYHNKEWAQKMREIGLIPSATGEPGGKETGQNMTHYIEQGGAFQIAFQTWEKAGFEGFMVDLWEDEATKKKRAKKAASKTRYTCPTCAANAWAKPQIKLICGDCDEALIAEDAEDEA